MYDDTIAAVATASGEAGVAIVRISGPRSAEVLSVPRADEPPSSRDD